MGQSKAQDLVETSSPGPSFAQPATGGVSGGLPRARVACGGRLTLDIRAVSADLFLCLRSMQVEVDAGWLKGHGVCSIPKDRAAAVRTLAEGLPCVLCFRDITPLEGIAPQLSSNV